MRLNKTVRKFYFYKYANKFEVCAMNDFLAKYKTLKLAQLHKNKYQEYYI